MKSQTATLRTAGLATVAMFATWAALATVALAQASGPETEAAAPEARSGGAAGPPRREGHAPAEAAPAEPEEAPPVAGGSCPDQRRKLELIV